MGREHNSEPTALPLNRLKIVWTGNYSPSNRSKQATLPTSAVCWSRTFRSPEEREVQFADALETDRPRRRLSFSSTAR